MIQEAGNDKPPWTGTQAEVLALIKQRGWNQSPKLGHPELEEDASYTLGTKIPHIAQFWSQITGVIWDLAYFRMRYRTKVRNIGPTVLHRTFIGAIQDLFQCVTLIRTIGTYSGCLQPNIPVSQFI